MGRLVKVSLHDVPLKLRRRYARHLVEQAALDGGYKGLEEARKITRAVLRPSERTYVLPEEAVVRMLGAVPNGQARKFTIVEINGVALTTPDGWV